MRKVDWSLPVSPEQLRALPFGEIIDCPIKEIRQHAYEIMHEVVLRHFEDQAKGIVIFDDRPNICKEIFRPLSV